MGMMYYGMGWYGALLSGLVFILATFVFSLIFWFVGRQVMAAKMHECCVEKKKKK